ncbi:MAG: alkaline phosphatase PhoX [Oligoflexales bacterium]
MKRRDVIKNGVKMGLGTALYSVLNRKSFAFSHEEPLFADSKGLLQVPSGFSVKLIQQSGDTMSDGYRMPGKPDGMACFPGSDNTIVLMRNHEIGSFYQIDNKEQTAYESHKAPAYAYDRASAGGVSRLVFNPETLELLHSNMVLSGTERNCAGGTSPWGYLTCEETVSRRHGYVFLCSTSANSLEKPRRIKCYGRFNHEAAVVDPNTHIAYLTEDRRDGCLYRFVPNEFDRPFTGKLQALSIKNRRRFDTSDDMDLNDTLEVSWVDLPRQGSSDNLRYKAMDRGAARIKRGEGIWLHDNVVYFSSTSGGPRNKGQIFALNINSGSDDLLSLVVQADRDNTLDMPDNITVSPEGNIFVAEDGSGSNYIRVVNQQGDMFTFAKNIHSRSEIAGLTFDPTGNTLFLNLQHDGITLAVTGPFNRY